MWALPEYILSLSLSSLSPIQLLSRTLSDGARQLVSQLKLNYFPPQACLNLNPDLLATPFFCSLKTFIDLSSQYT